MRRLRYYKDAPEKKSFLSAYNNMVSEKPPEKEKKQEAMPSKEWLKKDIMGYLEDHGIPFNTKENKSQLIALCHEKKS